MNKNIYRVGIYLRLSDEDKFKTSNNSESIINQRKMLMDEIDKHDDYLLYDEYCDEDLSGAGTYRPEFERLISDCKNGLIDIVLCKSQSRFSRDMEVIEKYINNKFIEWNIRFISLCDHADNYNPLNKKSRQINGLVNEWFLEDVSNNIRSAFLIKMKHGEYISPFAPYGYLIDKNNNNYLVIDPIASVIVKDIFNLYLEGYGYLGISKLLNERGILSPSVYKYNNGCKLHISSKRNINDIKWNSTAIKTILKNEIYIGNLIQGKRTTVSYKNHKIKNKPTSDWIKYENSHEAIINKKTFLLVQDEIKKRTKSRTISNKTYSLSGKVYCYKCHHYMKKKTTNKYSYLVCSNSVNGGCSNKHSIRYDNLEKIILDNINDLLKRNVCLDIIINLYNNSYHYTNDSCKILTKKKDKYLKLIKEEKLNLKKLYEDKNELKISYEQFSVLADEYIKKINNYQNICKQIDSSYSDYKDNIDTNMFTKYFHFDEINRLIVLKFIDNIYLDCESYNEKIIINWNV